MIGFIFGAAIGLNLGLFIGLLFVYEWQSLIAPMGAAPFTPNGIAMAAGIMGGAIAIGCGAGIGTMFGSIKRIYD